MKLSASFFVALPSASVPIGSSRTVTSNPLRMASAPFLITARKPAPNVSPFFGVSLSGTKQSDFVMRSSVSKCSAVHAVPSVATALPSPSDWRRSTSGAPSTSMRKPISLALRAATLMPNTAALLLNTGEFGRLRYFTLLSPIALAVKPIILFVLL